ncbi:MAG: TIGR03790 family protein [Nevskia sp.]|nr:TIGR03790 family protein [Nevskia sp.]
MVVNDSDGLSVAIGEYYRMQRHIPVRNMVHVRFDGSHASIDAGAFTRLKAAVDASTPPQVQAFALTWMRPYRVDCMSITTAFAAGFDPAFCSEGCGATRRSPYLDSDSRRPFEDLRLRPTMSIAAADIAQARALIDRGIAADGSMPGGTAYLGVSDDTARNVRAAGYADTGLLAGPRLRVRILPMPEIVDRPDVMFYFVGARDVPGLASNRFLPGAVGDHLTSFGGVLDGKGQMSALRWLEAGATGSYGTVVEPCNILGKFPSAVLLLRHYLGGESLLESYWKSVAMPGQGLFIGEPLSHPYSR